MLAIYSWMHTYTCWLLWTESLIYLFIIHTCNNNNSSYSEHTALGHLIIAWGIDQMYDKVARYASGKVLWDSFIIAYASVKW